MTEFCVLRMAKKHEFHVFVLATCLLSCQTVRQLHEPVTLPVLLQPMFGACMPSEEEATLEIGKAGARVLSAQMVWSFLPRGESSLQINSLIGDSILEIQNLDGKWTSSNNQVLKISETPDGLLNVAGYNLPLKSIELGCVLAGTWPASWLRWFSVTQDDRQGFQIEGDDGQREIKIQMSGDRMLSQQAIHWRPNCAYFSWGGFWGFFRNHATLCREKTKAGLNLRLQGLNDYSVNWTIRDDQ